MSNASGTDFRGTQNSDMAKELAKLKQELSASQAREAELTKELRKETLDKLDYEHAADVYRERAEAAEAKIKASQEQQKQYMCMSFGEWVFVTEADYYAETDPDEKLVVYLEPVIPPDLAELQSENAELTRNLEAAIEEGKRIQREYDNDE